MRSFSRVVQTYRRYRGGQSGEDFAAQLAGEAAADLQLLFNRHSWRFFVKEHDVDLWGTEKITLSSVSGTLLTITGTTDSKWVNQIVTLDGDPYTITNVLTTTTVLIAPSYSGAAISSGTSATIEQVRVALPDNFGAIIAPVMRGSNKSALVSPEGIILSYRSSGGQSGSDVHAVQGDYLLVLPAQANRLYFQYRKQFENLFQYDTGQVTVSDSQPAKVTGSGTQWSGIPSSGSGTVFESKANVARGFPISNEVLLVDTDTRLGLKSSWTGAKGSLFDYVISNDLDMPEYMDKAMQGYARYAAGKMDRSELENAVLDAIAADSPSDEPLTRGYSDWEPLTSPRVNRWGRR